MAHLVILICNRVYFIIVIPINGKPEKLHFLPKTGWNLTRPIAIVGHQEGAETCPLHHNLPLSTLCINPIILDISLNHFCNSFKGHRTGKVDRTGRVAPFYIFSTALKLKEKNILTFLADCHMNALACNSPLIKVIFCVVQPDPDLKGVPFPNMAKNVIHG